MKSRIQLSGKESTCPLYNFVSYIEILRNKVLTCKDDRLAINARSVRRKTFRFKTRIFGHFRPRQRKISPAQSGLPGIYAALAPRAGHRRLISDLRFSETHFGCASLMAPQITTVMISMLKEVRSSPLAFSPPSLFSLVPRSTLPSKTNRSISY